MTVLAASVLETNPHWLFRLGNWLISTGREVPHRCVFKSLPITASDSPIMPEKSKIKQNKKRFHLYKSHLPTTYESTQFEKEKKNLDSVTISQFTKTFCWPFWKEIQEQHRKGEMRRRIIGLSPNVRRNERRRPEDWYEAGEKEADAGGGGGRRGMRAEEAEHWNSLSIIFVFFLLNPTFR